MNKYDKLFHSENDKNFKEFQLASGYISSTTIYFELEKIAVKIEARGYIEFFDQEENRLAFIDIPEQTGGKESYENVLCGVEDGALILKLPIVEWIDNYPHCDGEHDRWDSRTIGYNIVTFDVYTNKITLG